MYINTPLNLGDFNINNCYTTSLETSVSYSKITKVLSLLNENGEEKIEEITEEDKNGYKINITYCQAEDKKLEVTFDGSLYNLS